MIRARRRATIAFALCALAFGAVPLAAQFTLFGNFTLSGSVSFEANLATIPAVGAGPDEVAVMTSNSSLSIISFATGQPTVAASIPMGGQKLLIGDVDGDGIKDLLACSGVSIAIARRTATGLSFMQSISPTIPVSELRNLHLVDIDGDSDLDLVMERYYALNDGLGNFGPQTMIFASIVAPFTTFPTDLDQDGDTDFLVRNQGMLTTYLWNGTALSPVPGAAFSSLGMWDDTIAIADIDGDGIQDVFAVGSVPTTFPTGATFFAKGIGGGFFQAPIASPSPVNIPTGYPLSVTYGDLDGDPIPDGILLVAPSLSATPANYAFSISAAGQMVPRPGPGSLLPNQRPLAIARFSNSGAGGAVTIQGNFLSSTTMAFFQSQFLPLIHDINEVSGGGQTVSSLDATPQPVVVEVVDALTGAPVAGVALTANSNAGLTTTPSPLPLSDSFGRIQFTVTGGSATGPTNLVLRAPTAIDLSLPFTVVSPVSISVVGGAGQWGFVGGAALEPIVFAAIRPNGTPWVGGTLSISATGGISLPPGSAQSTTDAQGRVSIVPTLNAAGSTFAITASLGTGPLAASASVPIAARRLLVTHSPGSPTIALNYTHEDGPTPLVVVADLPRTPTTTPYGDVVTSALSPLPGFAALDGLGLYGPIDPQVVANPVFARVMTNLPSSLFGTTLVFQAYGFDPSYPSPRDFFISPGLVRVM